jgi:hypothetical protein
MFFKFEHYDLAISEVPNYEFLRGHFSIIELKDRTVKFKIRIQKIKMNSLLSEGIKILVKINKH